MSSFIVRFQDPKDSSFFSIIQTLLLCIGAFLLFSVLAAFAVEPLWNWLLPDIFNLTKIDYWQALGITLLCGLLSGSILKF